MNGSIPAVRVGVERARRWGHVPCDRCGRDIQRGKNKGLHLCLSCRHDHIYVALVTKDQPCAT